MFDVSFGEVAVLTGVGIVLVGRRDLPYVSHAFGRQVGRVVGLLQGARLRADRFATDHQLKQLQNEFRSGLRELDAVKAELAGAMTNTGGGSLGAIVPGVDRRRVQNTPTTNNFGGGISPLTASMPQQRQNISAEYLAAAQQAEAAQDNLASHNLTNDENTIIYNLAPRSQAVAAVAEEEWEKRGIGFQSIAERGSFGTSSTNEMDQRAASGSVGGGAAILSNFMRQSLIYDQYERTVREQDEALRSRVEKVRNERSSVGSDHISSKK
jgi:Sec-independent protein translocase protein TatA